MSEYNKLLKNLETLQMDKIRELYPKYIEMTMNKEKKTWRIKHIRFFRKTW